MLIFSHGHSEFLLQTAQGFRILTDPFDAHVGYPMREVDCDAVTVSHAHGDHNYTQKARGSVVIADRPGRTVLAPDVTATGIPAWHDDRQGALRGENRVYIIEAEGLRIAHLGDLGAWDEALAQALCGLDIVFVPVGGYYTMAPEQAAALVRRIAPRIVIPMHYRTEYNGDWPIAPLDVFLREMQAEGAPAMPLLRVTKQDLSQHPRLLSLTARSCAAKEGTDRFA